LLVWVLPKIWVAGFGSLEKLDVITRALKLARKNKLVKKTWKSFVGSVVQFLEDGIAEAKASLEWSDDD
jgi:hypothetical protein